MTIAQQINFENMNNIENKNINVITFCNDLE